MAKLVAFAANIDDIDEGLRPLYVESEDPKGWLLDIDEKNYKKQLDEFRNNNRNLTKERLELQKNLDKFKDIDPEKYKVAQAALSKIDEMEEGELLKAGKLDEVVKKRTEAMKADYVNQVKAKDTELQRVLAENGQYKTKLGSLQIDTGVQNVITKVGKIRAGANDDILLRAHRDWSIDEKGNPVAKKGGEAIFGKSGDPITMEEWANNLLSDAPHLFEPAQGSGANGGSRGTGATRLTTVDKNDALAMGRNLVDLASGKAIAQ